MATMRFSRNAEKLLREIGKVKRFYLISGSIRAGFCCPLSAIYNEFFAGDGYPAHNMDFVWLGQTFTEYQLLRFKKMGLTPQTVKKIVSAADFTTDPYHSRLIYLLGIKEN